MNEQISVIVRRPRYCSLARVPHDSSRRVKLGGHFIRPPGASSVPVLVLVKVKSVFGLYARLVHIIAHGVTLVTIWSSAKCIDVITLLIAIRSNVTIARCCGCIPPKSMLTETMSDGWLVADYLNFCDTSAFKTS